jgi:tRNA threonylcarbamoyladenosine biosynthesis protein TsaB
MMILALEFSSPQRSAALARGDVVLSQAAEIAGRGAPAFDLVEKALADARVEREQVEMVAVGLGPGSYTGIRAAISIAQGWQLARNIKLAGAGSAEAIAMKAHSEKIFGRVGVVVDAQRNEVCFAAYEISEKGWREIEPLKIVTPAGTRSRGGEKEIIIGPEASKWFAHGRIVFPCAAEVARLAARGGHVAGEMMAPIYLRETNFVKAARP